MKVADVWIEVRLHDRDPLLPHRSAPSRKYSVDMAFSCLLSSRARRTFSLSPARTDASKSPSSRPRHSNRRFRILADSACRRTAKARRQQQARRAPSKRRNPIGLVRSYQTPNRNRTSPTHDAAWRHGDGDRSLAGLGTDSCGGSRLNSVSLRSIQNTQYNLSPVQPTSHSARRGEFLAGKTNIRPHRIDCANSTVSARGYEQRHRLVAEQRTDKALE